MARADSILSPETFRFFRDLGRNNNKLWMDANRERYRTALQEPLRTLLDRLAPAARKLNPKFRITGRTGENFSRINRDIRFAKDKSPYRGQMYLFFTDAGGEGGELYVGVTGEGATCGFRIYGGGRTSLLVVLGRARGRDNPKWIERQRKRLAKYESYWHATERGEWIKYKGWPAKPEEWKKIGAWIVRRKFSAASAVRSGFEREIVKAFRDVYCLYEFTTMPSWKA
jgi:uncharacterized protein (TIGR02453 family)